MKNSISIALRDVRLFAYHGYYEEERKAGNWFVVNVEVEAEETKKDASDELVNVINYETILEVVNEEMAEKRQLLETLVVSISDKLKSKCPRILRSVVTIDKQNPPLPGQCGSSSVSCKRSY